MKKMLGGILLAMGVLIAGTSGLCSLYFLVQFAARSQSSTDQWLPQILIVGGLPLAMGLGLFFVGRKLLRSIDTHKRPER
jgi:NhaP-type Na+/H+ or K+/H+ antiporter